MEGRMAAAEANIQHMAKEIKGAYRRIEKLEDKIAVLSAKVNTLTVVLMIAIPVMTNLISNFFGA